MFPVCHYPYFTIFSDGRAALSGLRRHIYRSAIGKSRLQNGLVGLYAMGPDGCQSGGQGISLDAMMVELLQAAYVYASSHTTELLQALRQHLLLVAVALGIGMVVCIPLGMWTARSRSASLVIINAGNTLRVVPSLAILFLAIPYFGLSFTSAAMSAACAASASTSSPGFAARSVPPSARLVGEEPGVRGLEPAENARYREGFCPPSPRPSPPGVPGREGVVIRNLFRRGSLLRTLHWLDRFKVPPGRVFTVETQR